MDRPLKITFRNMDRSETLAAAIEERCMQLEKFYRHIIGMHVIVEAPHRRHHRKGRFYRVMIEVHVPRKRLTTSHAPGREIRHENIIATVNDAFRAMSRQLEDYARKQRGDTKHHEEPLLGRVERVFPGQDYGFILLTDGQEVYFHKNSVAHDAFTDLEPGTPVRVALHEDESPQGPQASTVVSIGGMRLADKNSVFTGLMNNKR